MRLHPSLRTMIGMILLVALVIVYALFAMTIAVTRLADAGALTHLAFFVISGFVWVLPAMLIIKWMAKGVQRPG